MDKQLGILKFVKNATTKGCTTLAGSETFYFTDGHVYAYNDVIAIQAKLDYPIEGSVAADRFFQLLDKISQNDISMTDNEKEVKIQYGKHKATLRKEMDGLRSYMQVVFGGKYAKEPCPSDFLQALSIGRFQHYANKLAGILVDEDVYYALDSADIAKYTTEEGFDSSFWLTKEGVDLLLNLPEPIHECAVTNSFFYVFTDTYTIAIKLKIAEQYPLSTVEHMLSSCTDFTHNFTVNARDIIDALGRIKLGTMTDGKDNPIMHVTTGDELIISSVLGVNTIDISENLDYIKNNLEKKTYVARIDNVLSLVAESNTIHIIQTDTQVYFAVHSENHTHMCGVGIVK